MQRPIHASPLTFDRILRHAAGAHGQVEVVTASAEGAPRRLGYAQLELRARRLAGALADGGLKPGDVVAVIGAATARQLEAWLAITMTGAACHPINPALAPDEVAALLRTHGDKVVLADPDLLASLEPLLLKLPQLERVISMGEAGQDLAARMNVVVSQDALMETAAGPLAEPASEEDGAALLVHSAASGGATAWSHRICALQALAAVGPGGLGLTPDEALLVLTPLWRASGVAAVLAAASAGCKLVLPAGRTEPAQIRILADRESATVVFGSPDELRALHDQFRAEERRPASLKRLIATGAPCPQALVRAWRDSFGVEVLAAWGSAETAGLAAVGRAPAAILPLFGIELELLDADGRPRPRDGIAIGRLAARGPLVAAIHDTDLLDTGDLATIDAQGRIALLGRAEEQVFAAGGQIPAWPLEAAALEHPATARAAAIDPPRGMAADGPVLVIERKPGALAGKPDYLRFLGERLGGLGLGELLFVNSFPMDAAGRICKTTLRQRLEQLMAGPVPAEPEPPPVYIAADAAPPEPPANDSVPAPAPAAATPLAVPPPRISALALAGAAAPVLFQEEPEAQPEGEAVQTEAVDLSDAEEAQAPPAETADADIADPGAGEPVPSLQAEDAEPRQEQIGAADRLDLGPLDPGEAAASPRQPEDARPMVLRLEGRPHQARRRARQQLGRTALFVDLAALLALTPALMIAVGALGVRFDLLDWRVGVGQLMLDWPFKLTLLAVLGGVFAVFAAVTAGFRTYGLRAVFTLLLPLVTLAALIWLKSMGETYPPVHDVATDWTRPIAFSPRLIRERGPGAFPVEPDPFVPASAGAYMNRRVAEVNAETCPSAKPVVLSLPAHEAYRRARAALLARGLALISDAPAAGRLEATATGFWLGLKDDVAVRVSPAGPGGSMVDVRSVGRGGVSDYGANCRRVSDLVRLIAAQPASR